MLQRHREVLSWFAAGKTFRYLDWPGTRFLRLETRARVVLEQKIFGVFFARRCFDVLSGREATRELNTMYNKHILRAGPAPRRMLIRIR